MLHREIMAVYSEIHTKQINKLCGQKVEICNIRLVVPLGCKWLNLCYKTSQLIVCREIIYVRSEIHTKHIKLCGQNVGF